MREPSRRLPPLPPPTVRNRVVGWGCLLLLAAGVLTAAWQNPVAAGCTLAGITLVVLLAKFAEDHPSRILDRLIHSRPAKDAICRFARDFDCRRTDTWLIRAVFEEVQFCFSERRQPVPVRADDRLGDLGLDGDDCEEIAAQAAMRAGYSMADTTTNPLYGKVATVGGLVQFLQRQPCTRNFSTGRR